MRRQHLFLIASPREAGGQEIRHEVAGSVISSEVERSKINNKIIIDFSIPLRGICLAEQCPIAQCPATWQDDRMAGVEMTEAFLVEITKEFCVFMVNALCCVLHATCYVICDLVP